MAGLTGIPIGKFGRQGADFSTFLTLEEMRQRNAKNLRDEALARAQLGSDREFSFLNLEAKKAMADREEQLERDRMAQDQSQIEGAQQFTREQAAENERREVERRKQAVLDREADEKAQQAETLRRERREDKKQQDALAQFMASKKEIADKEAAKKTEETNRIQVRTKVRSIIADRVSRARQQGDASTPEQLRDMMMAETQNEDMLPADREEAQIAIQEWYQQEVKAEGTEFTREEMQAARKGRETAAKDRTTAQKESAQQRREAAREATTVRRISILQDELQDLRANRLKAVQARSLAETEAEAQTWDNEIAQLDNDIAAVRDELTGLSVVYQFEAVPTLDPHGML